MECMFSQKKSYSSCDHSCSHVGFKRVLVFLSFAVCILVIWNVYLQYQVYMVSGFAQNKEKKAPMLDKMRDFSEENDRAKNLSLQILFRERRSNGRLRNKVSTLEAKYTTLKNTIGAMEAAIMKKVVHLPMSNRMNRTILYTRVDNIANCSSNRGCLRWSTPLEEFKDSFSFIKDGNNMPVAIKITCPGIYHVYAQLAISGPDLSTNFDSTVGFEIVQVRGQQEFTLSKGIVTQDQRGRRYYNIPGRPFPVDTILAQGTFQFYCDDMIYVRQMGDTEFSFRSDTSYFGIVQVNPANLEYTDHSCDALPSN